MLDCRGEANGFEHRSGLHLYRVVDATALKEGNSAFLDWHWPAFAAEARDVSLLRGVESYNAGGVRASGGSTELPPLKWKARRGTFRAYAIHFGVMYAGDGSALRLTLQQEKAGVICDRIKLAPEYRATLAYRRLTWLTQPKSRRNPVAAATVWRLIGSCVEGSRSVRRSCIHALIPAANARTGGIPKSCARRSEVKRNPRASAVLPARSNA